MDSKHKLAADNWEANMVAQKKTYAVNGADRADRARPEIGSRSVCSDEAAAQDCRRSSMVCAKGGGIIARIGSAGRT